MLTQVHYTDVAQARQDKASEIDLTVIVKAIQNFSDYSGVMDKTDPFVEICLGTQMRRTSVKPNAGGGRDFRPRARLRETPQRAPSDCPRLRL